MLPSLASARGVPIGAIGAKSQRCKVPLEKKTGGAVDPSTATSSLLAAQHTSQQPTDPDTAPRNCAFGLNLPLSHRLSLYKYHSTSLPSCDVASSIQTSQSFKPRVPAVFLLLHPPDNPLAKPHPAACYGVPLDLPHAGVCLPGLHDIQYSSCRGPK